ncbi:hypothetical protein BTVI_135861 [Pitangus sulphuratus]|nr:hypothetical protein BTVI_135861 [Pitangus sulphuratus]
MKREALSTLKAVKEVQELPRALNNQATEVSPPRRNWITTSNLHQLLNAQGHQQTFLGQSETFPSLSRGR